MTLLVSRKALDNMGKRFRDNNEIVGDRKLIQDYRHFRSDELASGFNNLTDLLTELPINLSGRLKRTDTLIRKLRRERTMKLTNMVDIVGFRILVPNAQILFEVREILCDSVLSIKGVKDYITEPSQSGYQGIHINCETLKKFPGNEIESSLNFEIQLRTYFQHIWSTTSESMGEQVKEGGGSLEDRLILNELSDKVRSYESLNGKNEQIYIAPNDMEPVYVVINYDKSKGRVLNKQNFFQNFDDAIEHYKYLEDKFSTNFNNEIVLLVSNTESRLELSHKRYHTIKGRPPIPEQLR